MVAKTLSQLTSSKLPEDWEQVSISDILKLEYGRSLPAKNRLPGQYLVFGSGGQVGEHNAAITQAPVIVVGRKGSIGTVFFSEYPCWAIDTTYYLDNFPPYISPKYIYYFLKTLGLETFNRAAAIPGLSRDDVHSFQIPIPLLRNPSYSLEIQQRIVARIEALLAEVRSSRDLLNEIRRDGDQLLAVALSEVFSKLEPVADVVPLKEVATAFNGRASGSGISSVRVFKTRHVYPHTLRLNDPSYAKPEQVPSLPAERFLRPGDVLMANIAEGTLGRVSYVEKCEDSWTVDTQIMILRSKDEKRLIGKWLYYYLWSERGQQEIISRRTGIAFANKRGQTHIYPKNVVEILVPKPPINAQCQAVAYLDSALHETKKMTELMDEDARTLGLLEQSILERAFRGEL